MLLKKITFAVFSLFIAFVAQSQPTLIAPATGSIGVEETPIFEWSANTTGTYTLEILECQIDTTNQGVLELDNFALAAGPLPIAEIPNDLSGLTYNVLTNTFFAVSNGITAVYELDTNGSHIRTIALNGFEDTEGLVWIGGEEYFVVEERRGRAVKITIGTGTVQVNYPDTYIQLEGGWGNNLGIEGIAYEVATNSLFIIKEKQPAALYYFTIPTVFPDTIAPLLPFDIDINNFNCNDFSGLHFHQNLLILSHESQAVIETDLMGNEISRLSLSDNGAGGSLETGLFQAEGISIDNEGSIYVVSEPNTFYKFTNPNPTPLFELNETAFADENVNLNTLTLEPEILASETQYCWRVKNNATGEWSDYWTFTTGIITDIEQPQTEQGVQLFLHPSKGLLTANFQSLNTASAAQITIYNTSGKQVIQHQFNPSETQNLTLNTQKLPMGVYIFSLKINQENINRIFVKY